MDKTKTKFSQHIKLHLLILVGYIVLFLGSWATFIIGAFFFIPILLGISYAVFGLYKEEPINIKDAFKYMDKYSRSAALSHYTLLSLIYGLLLALIPLIRYILLNIFPRNTSELVISILLVNFITILIYISLQTIVSFATIIKIDTNVSTQQAISLSKKMVFSKPLYFIGMRFLFFFRNIITFMLLVLPILYYYQIIESPNSISGNPVTILFIVWFVLLVLSTPFYEKMMVKTYLKNKHQIVELSYHQEY